MVLSSDHQARNVELHCVSSEKFDKVYALEVGIHAAIGSHCSESLNSVPLDFILKDIEGLLQNYCNSLYKMR